MEIFSARVKWLRELKGLSQKEMADSVGMSPQGYGKIENGQREPSLEKLVAITKFLGESSDFLLGITDYDRRSNSLANDLLDYKLKIRQSREFIATLMAEPEGGQYIKETIEGNLKFISFNIDKFLNIQTKLLNRLSNTPHVSPSLIELIKSNTPE